MKRCLTLEHEVLTRLGWTSVKNAKESGAEIAAYALDGNFAKWERPSQWFSEHVAETVYTFEGGGLSQRVTGDHDMIVECRTETERELIRLIRLVPARDLVAWLQSSGSPMLDGAQFSKHGCHVLDLELDEVYIAPYADMEIATEEYVGDVYCPTVSTGTFIVRRDQRVSVTSNCTRG